MMYSKCQNLVFHLHTHFSSFHFRSHVTGGSMSAEAHKWFQWKSACHIFICNNEAIQCTIPHVSVFALIHSDNLYLFFVWRATFSHYEQIVCKAGQTITWVSMLSLTLPQISVFVFLPYRLCMQIRLCL
jgi:hypothetical protein